MLSDLILPIPINLVLFFGCTYLSDQNSFSRLFINEIETELKRKLNIFAYNKVKSIEDIDEDILSDLVISGAKWMYDQLNPKPIENPINYDFTIELQKYLDETPREKVLKDWEKSKSFDEIGPTVEEFLKKHKK